jgi:type 2 lantibiotic biosynthesis protein LanM
MTTVRTRHWWSPAFTLSERATLARRGRRLPAIDPDNASASPLDRWRKQRPFDRDEVFARRLELDALTEPEFASLVNAPSDCEGNGEHPPAWVAAVERANALATDIERLRGREPAAGPDGTGVARAFVEPFVATAMNGLFARARAVAQSHPAVPFEPRHATSLFEPVLWGHLVVRSMKVVILELNVARVEGSLAGDTPEARCIDFARQLRNGPVRERVIREYPVLARSLVSAAEYWEESAAEFLADLATDAQALSDTFFGGSPLGNLVGIVPGAGDGHRHGRSVTIAEFSTGERLVYKPRPLDVDLHFAELVDWLNTRGMTPPLRAVRTLGVGGHGWSEFIPNTPCTSPSQVARFYERFGGYLAILHALEATDFHYENVIASGEHPTLVDLEALFHPRSEADEHRDDPEWLGWRALQRSVLRAGVLPFRVGGSDESAGLDLSAVGGRGGQQSPNRFPVLVDAGTDVMRFARDYVRLPASQNRPALGTQPVDPAPFTDHIVSGFTAAYRLLLRHRSALLAVDGPLRRFADDSIRVVLRPTRQYALILGESHHPDVLRDAIERDRLIDRLWVAVPARPELERIIACEHADLTNGDVPLFMTRPSCRDLFTTHGTVIEEYFRYSGLESAIERIESMSEEDLRRQQWVVRASLVALVPGRHANAAEPPSEPRTIASIGPAPDRLWSANPMRFAADAECLEAAVGIARRLGELALRDDASTAWLGLTLVRDRDWAIQPIGTDLYGGTAGVALFLAYLDDVVVDDASKEMARAIVRQVVRRTDSLEASGADLPPGSIGAFGTLGGAVYALAHIGTLWNDHDLLERADRIAAVVARRVGDDRHLDIIGGAAGFTMAAAALHQVLPDGAARHAMRAAASTLLARRESGPDGASWTTTIRSTRPLTGMSHGASGIALALATSGRLLRDRSAVDVAMDALRYERGTFDPTCGNWPDYRILDDPAPATSPHMWAWCHGAPGIGLARLAVMTHVTSDELHADLDAALRSTAAFGFGSNDSLCHGDLGNLELLVRAREMGHEGAWERPLAVESARLLDRLRRGDWRCGLPGGVETPGLMMGLAGIGYGLLRLGATKRVPSLLSLDGPRAAICPRSDR